MRAWSTIDRWGPGVIALIILLAVIGIGWIYGERIAKIEGRCDALQSQVNSQMSSQEVQILQAHVVKLQQIMIQHGLTVPDIPAFNKEKEE